MAGTIKGITVNIDGNTTGLQKALSDVNSKTKDVNSELKQVNNLLKFDTNNPTLLTQKQNLLQESVANTRTKLQQLKDVQGQVEKQFESGNLGEDKYRSFQREMVNTQNQLKNTEKQLTEVQKTSGTVGQQISANFKSMGNSIKSAFTVDNIKSALGAIGLAAAGFLKSSIDSATAAQQKTQQLTQLLQNQGMSAKQAGSEINGFTKTITNMSSFSAGEAKDALSTLAQRGISAGDALKNASLIANIAAGRNMTLADAANTVADAYQVRLWCLLVSLVKAKLKTLEIRLACLSRQLLERNHRQMP